MRASGDSCRFNTPRFPSGARRGKCVRSPLPWRQRRPPLYSGDSLRTCCAAGRRANMALVPCSSGTERDELLERVEELVDALDTPWWRACGRAFVNTMEWEATRYIYTRERQKWSNILLSFAARWLVEYLCPTKYTYASECEEYAQQSDPRQNHNVAKQEQQARYEPEACVQQPVRRRDEAIGTILSGEVVRPTQQWSAQQQEQAERRHSALEAWNWHFGDANGENGQKRDEL
ncbi:hypothetical protein KM472_gp005 [Cynomolgus macaque cytomegalovirus strain Ottawa]|uniref:Uncharacterized protein n=1 Tax=macacine betaherpesvirus 8 TaxID=2560567 RepID=G8H108_9BETA|nr:hypothetical protein KM472_gp005 [Cynomolgus macaque cytomegalovirus strain Ottawa]AEQ32082.1 hypothetical protein cy05 [Cynomolgus macaque cytomegalovirus strain Ottawa]